MPLPSPIPPDLWRRLANLDQRCDVSMVRRTEWEHVGAGGVKAWSQMPPAHPNMPTRRAWYVRVELRGGAIHEMVHVTDLALADALEAAVSQAEARAWNRPPPKGWR